MEETVEEQSIYLSDSEEIRTIIKARGIAHPNVTGKTFAVFRVDSKHHLISLISQIDPSPDWIVGVSGLELCLPNCTWVEYKAHNLYPWDAGTDSGPTYISPDQPTNPRVPIKRIRTNDPNDPRSPFYDTSGAEMKPLARLYITRQRLYEKNCENSSGEDDQNACETLPWSEWSECSTKCGKGKRHRQREYKDSVLAHRMGCKRKLTQRKPCEGEGPDCDNVPTEEEVPEEEEPPPSGGYQPECALTLWSEWSSCSATCGKGTRTKSRKYVNRKARKKCEAGSPNKPPLEINEDCFGTECTGDISENTLLDDHPECRMSKWSSWSPCSVTCGDGIQKRQRRVLYRGVSSPDGEDPCANVKKEEVVTCVTHKSCDLLEPPESCLLPPEVGHCRSTNNRWFYDQGTQDCAIFPYSGCGGNDNNFESREDCLETCRIENEKPPELEVGDLRLESIANKVDCKVSNWVIRPCNVTCGEGVMIKTRKVLRYPRLGGKPCPKRMVRIEQCFMECPDLVSPYTQAPHHPRSGKRHRNQNYEANPEEDDCRYSHWSPWSPCSATCGTYVLRQRTRVLLNQNQLHKCVHRVQNERCIVPECSDDYE
ncbi:unnamed protein product [Hermetia illucens]|uniref:Spondin-1 n=1 Tax=Hermetia illucens TaxID=343691 RepID=A0A7R8UVZ7_HERIL|nr:unnamed protein product [Hermetia illucens]